MKHTVILAEGETEKQFVMQVLIHHLVAHNILPDARLVETNPAKQAKGGLGSYGLVRNNIQNTLSQRHIALVTTMFDYYHLPTDFPGYNTLPAGTCYQRVAYLEQALIKDIDHPKFHPFLTLHEFEALLFTAPEEIAGNFAERKLLEKLKNILEKYDSPEEINELKPPSKYLLELLQ